METGDLSLPDLIKNSRSAQAAGLAGYALRLLTDAQMQVWKGIQLTSEQSLHDTPCASVSYYSDAHTPRVPALAVATGSHVFIYRNLRPYYRFSLPKEVPHEEERTVWYLHYPLQTTVHIPVHIKL